MKIQIIPVGVTFPDSAPNVALLKVGDTVSFLHAPAFYGSGDKRKEYPNAIKIMTESGQVGSLAESDSPESPQQTILRMIKGGKEPVGTVTELMIPAEKDTFKRTYKLEVEVPDIVTKKEVPKSAELVEKQTSFTGEEILYYPISHKYTDIDGNVLKGGSTYATENSPKFDLKFILSKSAKSWGVDEKGLGELWKMQGQVSMEHGTSLHTAIEMYHLHHKIGAVIQEAKGLEYNYALPKNEYLRNAVLAFEKEFGLEGKPEVLVTDVARKMAGRIDLLEVIDDKTCIVTDTKTGTEIDKAKLKKYQLQLSYYASILIAFGWTVPIIKIRHWNGECWSEIISEVLEIK